MKYLLMLVFILVSLTAYSGEKGNGLEDVTDIDSLQAIEHVLRASAEAKEVTLKQLAKKSVQLDSGKVIIQGLSSLNPLSIEMKRYCALLRIFITHDEQELLEDITIANTDFYSAFSVKDLKGYEDLSLIEKEEVASRVRAIYLKFWIQVRDVVVQNSSLEKWNKFKDIIDQDRLGYKLP